MRHWWRLIVAAVLVEPFVLAASAGRGNSGKSSSPLSASVTAEGSWLQSFHWSISKSASPTSLEITAGGSGDADWTIAVTKEPAAEVFSVVGDRERGVMTWI